MVNMRFLQQRLKPLLRPEAGYRWRRALDLVFWLLTVILLLTVSNGLPPGDPAERARAFTREVEFDYVAWTLDALQVKLGQAALGTAGYLPVETRRDVLLDYLGLAAQIQHKEHELRDIYADPQVSDPQSASAGLRAELEAMVARRALLAPLAEEVLQRQLGMVAAELGLTLGGQPLPPILFHSTPTPRALIVSPREVIRQDQNISIDPALSLEEHIALEERVAAALNVSTLVVNIGGIGVYPTMVMETSDLNWLSEVTAHEWIHNYLTLRPLGLNYESSPQLRTMNETVAAIAGKEIGRRLVERFYPEHLPPPPPEAAPAPSPAAAPQPPAFDFNAEMRITRLEADRLLAEGQIAEAEAYMEARRVFFWENGYHLRKLNQAYFAFYGAYADQPGGAAGEDPVGAAVRALRAQSASLREFVNRISWMVSFEQLEGALEGR
ncbi:MAG: hypothetical protein L0Z70_10180 [Chloroflexi bacterium]|nr:hypothetical protein [Chloroflexota bacterium]